MSARIAFREPSGAKLREAARRRETDSEEDVVFKASRPEVKRAWRDYLAWLGKMRDLAKAKGIPFILLASPTDFQLVPAPGVDSPQRILEEFCAANGIHFVDPLPRIRQDLVDALRGAAASGPVTDETGLLVRTAREHPERIEQFWTTLFLDGNHPSPLGHRYLAQVLYPLVSRLLGE
jgi:lysophospholipase L1-like esterase